MELAIRKSKLKFYEVNPFDVPGAEQTCQTIASSHPFVVLDVGALSSNSASDCIPTAKVPFASSYLTPDQLTKYYPYYLSVGGLEADSLRTGILALKQLGYFTEAKGFKKLGVLLRDLHSRTEHFGSGRTQAGRRRDEQDRAIQFGLSDRRIHAGIPGTGGSVVQDRWCHRCNRQRGEQCRRRIQH